ncbi:MAG TPA: hydantoinase B/oxoprolinase family protein, partial [Steroidobacteraceae bacterium]|nr:hydantoinase B/oxoprolinase family protein [Steroidobacteraceae bacterium]
DGLVRRIEFRAPMAAAILSNHRRIAPFGLAGGGDGATGVNRLERAGGDTHVLPGCAIIDVEKSDALVIETPGGGGFGRS